ncbi:MAG: hypothetical protein ABSB87_17645 [Terriglobales bacterium]
MVDFLEKDNFDAKRVSREVAVAGEIGDTGRRGVVLYDSLGLKLST